MYGSDAATAAGIVSALSNIATTGISTVGTRRQQQQALEAGIQMEAVRQRRAVYDAQIAATQAKAKQTQYVVYGFVAVSALILVAGLMKQRGQQ